jgi:hypothetical protein
MVAIEGEFEDFLVEYQEVHTKVEALIAQMKDQVDDDDDLGPWDQ